MSPEYCEGLVLKAGNPCVVLLCFPCVAAIAAFFKSKLDR